MLSFFQPKRFSFLWVLLLVFNLPFTRAQDGTAELQRLAETGHLRQIPGDPNALAWNSLPYLDYDYTKYYETDFILSMDGRDYIPVTFLVVGFNADVTISAVNKILADFDARIIYADPGRVDKFASVGLDLVLRVQSNTPVELLKIANKVNALPEVHYAFDHSFEGIYLPLLEAPKDMSLEELSGAFDDLALNAVPFFEYYGVDGKAEFSVSEGYYISTNMMAISFLPDVTVGEVNELLDLLSAEIVGVHSERSRFGVGLRIIARVPTRSNKELNVFVSYLNDLPIVCKAVEYFTYARPSSE
jgi:hypothetical protein